MFVDVSHQCALSHLHWMGAPVHVSVTLVLHAPAGHIALFTQQVPAVPAIVDVQVPDEQLQSTVPPQPSSRPVPHLPA